MNFSFHHRADIIGQLKSMEFDVVIIGGGVTGAGIALDAISRGFAVALVEKGDFASGTSSKSTKLIHGGLRYLKQFEFALVAEVGRERAIVHNNARHLVLPEQMLLPLVEGGSIDKWSASIGLFVYDLLAGVKFGERRKMLTPAQTHKAEPLLRKENLKGGSMYFEYRTDDSRLVMALIKKAHEMGAACLNYVEATRFSYSGSVIDGIAAKDQISGQTFEIKARKVINAAGPWVDFVRKVDNSLQGKRLQLTKGVHLVVKRQSLPIKQAIYFDVADGRMVFAIPREGTTYIGTTDTVYSKDIDKPVVDPEDVDYLLRAVNQMFSGVELTRKDIISSWAGLRPLIHEEGKSPSELSRKDEIFFADSGLISIAGGKLTGYRKMSERVMDIVAKEFARMDKVPFRKCATKNLQLSGGEFESDAAFASYFADKVEEMQHMGISPETARAWLTRYGKNVEQVIRVFKDLGNRYERVQLLELIAELKYCIDHELVCRLDDFLIRRTAILFFKPDLIEANLDALSGFLSSELHLSKEHASRCEEEFFQFVQDATVFL